MRRLKSVKPCEVCGEIMTDCETDPYCDGWNVSVCTGGDCRGWKDVTQMIKEGSKIEEIN